MLIFRFSAWILCIVSFFQIPSWSFYCNCSDWNNSLIYPSSGIPYIPYPVYISISFVTIVILSISLYLEFEYEKHTDRAILLYVFTLLLFSKFIEVLVGIITLSIQRSKPLFALSPVEALTVLLVERKYTSKIWYSMASLPSFSYLVVILASSICSYVILGFLIFQPNSSEYDGYFDGYKNALWNMFMVFTASNWPNPMIPAYDENRFYFLYFFGMMVLFHWGLLNVLLGFVYALFSEQKDKVIDKLDQIKKSNIEQAYRVLDSDSKGYVTYDQVVSVLEVMFAKYEHGNINPTKEELIELVSQLNNPENYENDSDDNNMIIVFDDFSRILDTCSAQNIRILRSNTHFDRVFQRSSIDNSEIEFKSNGWNKQKLRHPLQLSYVIDADHRSRRRHSNSNSISNSINNINTTNTTINNSNRRKSLESIGSLRTTNFIENNSDRSNRDIYQNENFNVTLSTIDGEIDQNVIASTPNARYHRSLFMTGTGTSAITGTGTRTGINESDSNRSQITYKNQFFHIPSSNTRVNFQMNPIIESNKTFEFDMKKLWSSADFYSFVANLSLFFETIYYFVASDMVIFILGTIYISIAYTYQGLLITIFLLMFFEQIIKLTVKGFYRYRQSYRNSFDGAIIIALFIAMIIAFSEHYNSSGDHNEPYYYSVRTIILLRVIMFLPRTLILFPSVTFYRKRMIRAFDHALSKAGHFYFLLLVLLVFMYIFACIGVHIFGGAINYKEDTVEKLSDSYYGQSKYYPLNFNDIPSGMVTMFVLLYVNNMHVTISGFVATVSIWAEFYFTLWYVIGVLFLLNILVAFFLNEFISYLRTLEQSNINQNTNDDNNDNTNKDSTNNVKDNQNQNNQNSSKKTLSSITNLRNLVESRKQTLNLINYDPRAHSNNRSNVNESNNSVQNSIRKIRSQSQSQSQLSSQSQLQSKKRSRSTDYQSRNSAATLENNVIQVKPNYALYSKLQVKEVVEETTTFTFSVFADSSNRRSLQERVDYAYQVSRYIRNGGTGRNYFSQALSSQSNSNNNSNSSGHIGNSTVVNGEGNRLSDGQNNDQFITYDNKPKDSNIMSIVLKSESQKQENSIFSRLNIFKGLCYNYHAFIIDDENIDPIETSAVYLQLAVEGYNIQVHKSKSAQIAFQLWTKFFPIVRTTTIIHAILRYFERPWWTYRTAAWDDSNIYPLSGIAYLKYSTMAAIYIPILCIILSALLLEVYFLDYSPNPHYRYFYTIPTYLHGYISPDIYRKFEIFVRKFLRYGLIFYAIFQIILNIIFLSSPFGKYVSVESILAVNVANEFFLIWFHQRTLEKLIIFLQLTPILSILVMALLLLILFFAIFGSFIYQLEQSKVNDDYDAMYISTYQSSLWSIFVSMTSSSYPNQIIPEYDHDRSTFFYFFTYISIGSFGLLNLVFIVILTNLQKGLVSVRDEKKVRRQMFLIHSFEMLDTYHQGYVDKSRIKELLDILYGKYRNVVLNFFDPVKNDKRNLVANILDINEDGTISLSDFMYVLEVMRLKFTGNSNSNCETPSNKTESNDQPNNKNNINSLFMFTPIFNHIKRFYSWEYAAIVIDVFLVSTIIANLAISGEVYRTTRVTNIFSLITYILWTIDCLFVYYIASRVKISGGQYIPTGVTSTSGRLRLRHKIDLFLMTILSLLYIAIIISLSISVNTTSLFITNRVIQCLRIVIAPRNLLLVLPNQIIAIIFKILKGTIKSIQSMTLAFYFITYIFLVIGIYTFGGKIVVSNKDNNGYYDYLLNSQFASNGYWNLNFNDYPSGLVTLISALYVSNWDVIASGFSAVTSYAIGRCYFSAWYAIGVLLVLSALRSFFVAEFVNGITKIQKDPELRKQVFQSKIRSSSSISIENNESPGRGSRRNNETIERSSRKNGQITLIQNDNNDNSNKDKDNNNNSNNNSYKNNSNTDFIIMDDHTDVGADVIENSFPSLSYPDVKDMTTSPETTRSYENQVRFEEDEEDIIRPPNSNSVSSRRTSMKESNKSAYDISTPTGSSIIQLFASMEDIKDLDYEGRQRLRRRLQHLDVAMSPGGIPAHALFCQSEEL